MFGGKAVAVRNGGTLEYLHGDHLGSASVSTNTSGDIVSERRYYPYGEVRWSIGTLPTDYTYTAQREEASMGLMDYRARYYDPYINRFIQADTIVPEPGSSQAYNRYMFVTGNPLRYTDPSGHIQQGDEENEAQLLIRWFLQRGIHIVVDWGWTGSAYQSEWKEGMWTIDQLNTVKDAVSRYDALLGGPEGTKNALDGVKIQRRRLQSAHKDGVVYLSNYAFSSQNARGTIKAQLGKEIAVAHELSHYWDYNENRSLSGGLLGAVGNEPGPTDYARTGGIYEHWAETATMFLYPEYIDQLKEEYTIARARGSQDYQNEYYTDPYYPGATLGPGLFPKHWNYIQDKFDNELTVAK